MANASSCWYGGVLLLFGSACGEQKIQGNVASHTGPQAQSQEDGASQQESPDAQVRAARQEISTGEHNRPQLVYRRLSCHDEASRPRRREVDGDEAARDLSDLFEAIESLELTFRDGEQAEAVERSLTVQERRLTFPIRVRLSTLEQQPTREFEADLKLIFTDVLGKQVHAGCSIRFQSDTLQVNRIIAEINVLVQAEKGEPIRTEDLRAGVRLETRLEVDDVTGEERFRQRVLR